MNVLTLRKPEPRDLAPVFNLANDYGSKFLDDYHEVSDAYIVQMMHDPFSFIVADNGFPIGLVWFTDKLDDLHSEIHFLIRPEYWRPFIKQKLGAEIISQAFVEQNVLRFYAYTMDNQRTAFKLLKSLHFFSHKPWMSHTKQAGKRRDVTFHELKRSTWRKQNG
jgi:RimJ/RimL family protein N-acetyltransferase